ncbi:MAG: glycine cleavage system aminomethyltransferase GcvT [Candidatus Saganbacteria bacterium]|nr:glycine cleavage system aminomethyltransferase GcvT [Candidatus Saganbacteria bacterium]
MKQTPLHRNHLLLKAKMVEFGGWEMPLSYAGIISEHQAVRTSAGLFDIGHMGQIKVSGSDAFSSLQLLTCNNLSLLSPYKGQYSVLCNERGGTIDDLFIYQLPDYFFVVANASNTEKVLNWLRSRVTPYTQIDHLEETNAALSLQGPKAAAVLQPLCNTDITGIKRNLSMRITVKGVPVLVTKTGYTGEDGFEFFFEKAGAKQLWEGLIDKGAIPCGLGARDTLRLEAGLPLYGHEYNDETSPLEVGYKWAVKMDKGDFIGKEALQKMEREGLPQKLFGLVFDSKVIPRQGFSVFKDVGEKEPIGTVTSGTFSPTLKRPIAMAFLKNYRENPKEVYVKIRDVLAKAEVIALPFYKK